MFSFRLPLILFYFTSGASFMSFYNLYEAGLNKYSFVMFGISAASLLIATILTGKLESKFYNKGYQEAMNDGDKWFFKHKENEE